MANSLLRTLAAILYLAIALAGSEGAVQKPTRLHKTSTDPSFVIDKENNQFLKDGKPYRYVAGSLHYMRVPNQYWYDRMIKYRAAGLNAIQTIIEWASHEPELGQYSFEGDNDIDKFLQLAQKAGLDVLLRLGPYICAERDMGGFPYWLLRENPNMKLRSSDKSYIQYVTKWFNVLLPKIKPYLHKNGGPVLMVQIENEYGSYPSCDFDYTAYLRDMVREQLGDDVVIYTTDGYSDGFLKCGKTQGVFATVDFGPGTDPVYAFSRQILHQGHGPYVNSEFYPGWLDHWQEKHATVGIPAILNTFNKMMDMNASVNFYMFHGGTNFGFTNGANGGSNPFDYQPDPTSYDYDAPLNEAGDPTPKYYAIRDAVGKYLPLPNDIPVPKPSPKMALAPIQMKRVTDIFALTELFEQSVVSQNPLTFEQLSQPFGFVRYSTHIKVQPTDPALLSVSALGDRAWVYVDGALQGILSRMNSIISLPIRAKIGSKLDLIVEHQGRIGYGGANNEKKGIIGNVTLGKSTLQNWTHYLIFKNWTEVIRHIEKDQTSQQCTETGSNPFVASFYTGTFQVPEVSPTGEKLPLDTFLRLDGWGKGVAFLNGFNLGRYWPQVGPQVTLYAPAVHFKPSPAINTLTLLELEESPCGTSCLSRCVAKFVKEHVLNATVPVTGRSSRRFRENPFSRDSPRDEL